jgi:hypothetical protein
MNPARSQKGALLKMHSHGSFVGFYPNHFGVGCAVTGTLVFLTAPLSKNACNGIQIKH